MKKRKIHIKPNALELFGIRKVFFLPEHFERSDIAKDTATYETEANIEDWILQNTHGRYYIKSLAFDRIIVAFEQPKEMSYFLLAYK
jgi:hypothetical protein